MNRTAGPVTRHPHLGSPVAAPASGTRVLLTVFVTSLPLLWTLLKLLPLGCQPLTRSSHVIGSRVGPLSGRGTDGDTHNKSAAAGRVSERPTLAGGVSIFFPKEGPPHESWWQLCIPALRSPGLCVWTQAQKVLLNIINAWFKVYFLSLEASWLFFGLFSFFLFSNSINI